MPRISTAARDRRRYDVDVDLGGGRRLTGTVPRSTATAGLGHLLQARRQASTGVLDPPAGVDRSLSGPGLVRGVHRAAANAAGPPSGAHARAAGGPRRRRARVIWWRSTTPVAASRFRCRSRRPTRGPKPGTPAATRTQGGVQMELRQYPGENADPAHLRVWGRSKLDVLMQTVRPGEECDGEATRLGATPLDCGCRCSGRRGLPGPDASRFDLLGPLPARNPRRCWRPVPEPARRSRWPAW